MAARLQQANASANPILVLFSSASGHGMGTALAERIAENADVLALLFTQLGMTQPKARDFERSV
jgi:prolyl oligopeptidase